MVEKGRMKWVWLCILHDQEGMVGQRNDILLSQFSKTLVFYVSWNGLTQTSRLSTPRSLVQILASILQSINQSIYIHSPNGHMTLKHRTNEPMMVSKHWCNHLNNGIIASFSLYCRHIFLVLVTKRKMHWFCYEVGISYSSQKYIVISHHWYIYYIFMIKQVKYKDITYEWMIFRYVCVCVCVCRVCEGDGCDMFGILRRNQRETT